MSQELVIRSPQSKEFQAIRRLRYEILDQDKGMELKTISRTDDMPATVHMAAFINSEVVCTIRLNPLEDDPAVYLVRRMATSINYQGQGIGAKVLRAAEAEAIRRGAKGFVLDAREKAVAFYARAGYWPTGQRPIHAGDVNITMVKSAPGINQDFHPPISIKSVVFEDNRVWLRRNEFNKWELPGGRLENGEQPVETIIRELNEELGIEASVERLLDTTVWYKNWGKNHEIMIISYLCRLKRCVGGVEHIGEAGPAEFRTFALDELADLDLPEPYRRAISLSKKAA